MLHLFKSDEKKKTNILNSLIECTFLEKKKTQLYNFGQPILLTENSKMD